MTARLGLVLLGEVLLLALPAFAQRPAPPNSGNDRDEAKASQIDVAGVARPAQQREAERGERGRMIYTSRGAIFTNRFNAPDNPPGWSHGRKVGWGSCDEPPGQAGKDGCPRSLRRWLLGRWLKRRGLKHRPPVIQQDPDR
jgi:hypothetical protein